MATLLRAEALPWTYDDGGRADAGFRGEAGDCGARAFAIATGRPYGEVYEALAALEARRGRPRSARNGILPMTARRYGDEIDMEWTPTMRVGSGCQVHLALGELPPGRLVVSLSKHYAAVVEGVVHDVTDPTRGGTRCVYGYWSLTWLSLCNMAQCSPDSGHIVTGGNEKAEVEWMHARLANKGYDLGLWEVERCLAAWQERLRQPGVEVDQR